jgi:hypothetical protein
MLILETEARLKIFVLIADCRGEELHVKMNPEPVVFCRISMPIHSPNAAVAIDLEQEVIAHLSFVAAEQCMVTSVLEGQPVDGMLGYPDFDEDGVPFQPSAVQLKDLPTEVEKLRGRKIRISYQLDGESFSFLTLVKRQERHVDGGQTWWLCIPAEIEGNQRRFARRTLVQGDWGFRARKVGHRKEDQDLEVFDVSSSGMSLVFDGELTDLHDGRFFAGLLEGPDGAMRLRAQVRNVVELRDGTGRKLAGCVFQGFGFVNHARLARMLAKQGGSRAV